MQSVSGCKETKLADTDSPSATKDTSDIDITRRTTITLKSWHENLQHAVTSKFIILFTN